MNKDPQKINLSLVSHTNVGKTTLARTLLGRDIGEVGDRSHVTTEPEDYVLLRAPDDSELILGIPRDSATVSVWQNVLKPAAIRSAGSRAKSGIVLRISLSG